MVTTTESGSPTPAPSTSAVMFSVTTNVSLSSRIASSFSGICIDMLSSLLGKVKV